MQAFARFFSSSSIKTIPIDTDSTAVDWMAVQAQFLTHQEPQAVWNLDLCKIGMINSEFFGHLMRLHEMARAQGSRLVIKISPDSEVMSIMRWFKVLGFLEIVHA